MSAPSLTLRRAGLSDADRLYQWRIDPVTRENSRSTEDVAYHDHLAWLRRSLLMPERGLFIAEQDGTPIGTGRLDWHSRTAVEVSVTVAPAYRGHGYAAKIVALLVAQARRDGATEILAEIKPQNTPSLRAFDHAGFGIVRHVLTYQGHREHTQ